MKLMRIIALAAMLAFGAFVPAASARDINDKISAYNDAVTNGNKAAKLRTANELGIAAMQSSGRDDAVLMALEAAKTLCLYGDCKAAAPIAEWVSGRAAADDNVSATEAQLTVAFAKWRNKKGRSTRKPFDDALSKVIESDLTSLTLAAFQHRYAYDARKGHWAMASKSAAEASQHYAPFRGAIGEQWSDAEMIRIIANFNMTPEPQEVIDMAKHHVALSDMIDMYSQPRPAWIFDHFFRTLAWESALEAYYRSGGGERHWSNLAEEDLDVLLAQGHSIMREASSPGAALGKKAGFSATRKSYVLPFCDGKFDMKPQVRYGGVNAHSGRFGSVIMRIDIAEGKVSDIEVLAAVPQKGFSKNAVEAVSQWTWIVEDGVPGETCRLEQENFIQEVLFFID